MKTLMTLTAGLTMALGLAACGGTPKQHCEAAAAYQMRCHDHSDGKFNVGEFVAACTPAVEHATAECQQAVADLSDCREGVGCAHIPFKCADKNQLMLNHCGDQLNAKPAPGAERGSRVSPAGDGAAPQRDAGLSEIARRLGQK